MEVKIIGKSSSCDVVISDNTVSREHAQLVMDNDTIEIIDLDSTNGTYVNGERITKPTRLTQGDEVVLGGVEFIWQKEVPKGEKPDSVQVVTNEKEKASVNWIYAVLITAVLVGILSVVFVYNWESQDTGDNGPLTGSPAETTNSSTVGSEDLANSDPATETTSEVVHNGNTNTSIASIEPGSVDYDFSCLNTDEDEGTTEWVGIFGAIDSVFFDEFGAEVSVREELDLGRDVLRETTVHDSGSDYNRLIRILNKLTSKLPSSSAYRYNIHYVNEDQINAYTVGGQIFVYEGMINFCRNDDELAAIIAHEIAHNELGHINAMLVKEKTANEIVGDEAGWLTAQLYMGLTVAFNQKQETHCDLYGIDLAFKAGYNACDVIDVWKRMEDDDFQLGDNLVRSHPYSSQRSACCANHIEMHHPQRNCSR